MNEAVVLSFVIEWPILCRFIDKHEASFPRKTCSYLPNSQNAADNSMRIQDERIIAVYQTFINLKLLPSRNTGRLLLAHCNRDHRSGRAKHWRFPQRAYLYPGHSLPFQDKRRALTREEESKITTTWLYRDRFVCNICHNILAQTERVAQRRSILSPLSMRHHSRQSFYQPLSLRVETFIVRCSTGVRQWHGGMVVSLQVVNQKKWARTCWALDHKGMPGT